MFLRKWIPQRLVFKIVWIVCSCCGNHYRLNSQHNRGKLYDHLMSTQIFTLMINKVFVRAPKITRKVGMASIWNLQWCFSCPRRRGLVGKSNHWRPTFRKVAKYIRAWREGIRTLDHPHWMSPIFAHLGGPGNNFRSGQKFPGKAAPARFWRPPKFVGGYLLSAGGPWLCIVSSLGEVFLQ